MARTRLVKPGIFRNEYLWECDPLARYFWIGLWCHADYRGVVEWRPKRLKADILPCDDCDVDALSEQLAANGFLVFFESDGQRYVHIPNFEKHQHPHKKERDAGSCLPEPPGAGEQRVELGAGSVCAGMSPEPSGRIRVPSPDTNTDTDVGRFATLRAESSIR